MGKITIQIPEQNYELIRDRIGEILAFELADQTEAADIKDIWRERVIPINQDEMPAINVTYGGTDLTKQHLTVSIGESEFFIDVHVNAVSTDDDNGDKLAALKAERIAGIIRYIFDSSEYRTLDFDPGLIQNRYVSNIAIGRPGNADSTHTIIARVTLKVTANEFTNDLQPVTAEGYTTQVKLDETEKGHKFILNN